MALSGFNLFLTFVSPSFSCSFRVDMLDIHIPGQVGELKTWTGSRNERFNCTSLSLFQLKVAGYISYHYT